MNITTKAVLDFLLSPTFLAMVVGGIVFLVVRRRRHFRLHQQARDEQAAALSPLAARLGGTVITGEQGDAAAWSAGVLGPLVKDMKSLYNIVLYGKWLRRSKPQWDLAMDFQRGDWHVRVTEAAVRIAAFSGYGVRWEQEHRIEVATARMAPLRMVRPNKYGYKDKPLSPSDFESQWHIWLSEPPATAQHDHAQWQRVQLAPPMDQEFFVWGSDPAAVHRDLNFDALHWLIDQEENLPVHARSMRLTFEAGFVYFVTDNHIDQATLMTVVDLIVGLLDRMPGARPRHPAAAV